MISVWKLDKLQARNYLVMWQRSWVPLDQIALAFLWRFLLPIAQCVCSEWKTSRKFSQTKCPFYPDLIRHSRFDRTLPKSQESCFKLLRSIAVFTQRDLQQRGSMNLHLFCCVGNSMKQAVSGLLSTFFWDVVFTHIVGWQKFYFKEHYNSAIEGEEKFSSNDYLQVWAGVASLWI